MRHNFYLEARDLFALLFCSLKGVVFDETNGPQQRLMPLWDCDCPAGRDRIDTGEKS